MENSEKKSEIAKKEEEVLKFWKENKIFEKSLDKKSPQGDFIFYDGPPFATGEPHYGHLLQGAIKDLLPRYKTMQGYHVTRRWGWDCHGLPVENIVEKELNLKNKKDIEEYGIEKFNEAARKSVLRYVSTWKEIVPRMGRWIDMENDYKTMDPTYMETVWWIFKELFSKKMIYEGYKVMHLCPRCETTLANFEVSQGYKNVKDLTVTAKFELVDEPGTFLLAWTTTPWTLPGNVALVVGEDIKYVKVKQEDSYYVLAKDMLGTLTESAYEIIEEIKGSELVGKRYVPLFTSFFEDKTLQDRNNGWKVYSADFVTTEEGTGVVHIAPAFGEDDLKVKIAHNLPFIQHVSKNGEFVKLEGLSGKQVKPKSDPQASDVEIVKILATNGTLYKKEKYEHSYPHCWRCDTPLINYATNSWFIDVARNKKKMLSENRNVLWVPEHLKNGRFSKGLEEAPDWAISRSRFWGAPLPVWRDKDSGEIKVMGSIDDLKSGTSRGNTFYILRHGQAESNAKGIISSLPDNPHHLTQVGKKQVDVCTTQLEKKNIDFIYASDFIRTKETAELMASRLGIPTEKIIYDKRIREINGGDFNLKPIQEYRDHFSSIEEKFSTPAPGGESIKDVKMRVGEFLYEIDSKLEKKNILVVSHEYVLWMIDSVSEGLTDKEIISRKSNDDYFKNGEWREIKFAQLSHDRNYVLDLHRPYIDEIDIRSKTGNKLTRVPEVFDCWFESGSMPYGQSHHPFENINTFNPKKWLRPVGFPADFIGEAIDQTRGWFYSMHVLSTALFGRGAFKNVIVTGLILDEKGEKKLSKSLQNYPDPMYIANSYGADALRFYLLSSPLMRGEDLNFSEKGVSEVLRKIIMRLLNVHAFYMLGKSKNSVSVSPTNSKNVLDIWILSRLAQTNEEVQKSLDIYQVDRATRPIESFIEDLSLWYVRRSRERFKKSDDDRDTAESVLRHVLMEISKIIAPFMPFTAESIFREIKIDSDAESVHLEKWPQKKSINIEVLAHMKSAREIVERALSLRNEECIKVRQPLASITIKSKLDKDILKLVRDEVNVKKILIDENAEYDVALDTKITDELKSEGEVREIIRSIQEERKKALLNTGEKVDITIHTDETIKKLIEAHLKKIQEVTNVSKIRYASSGEKLITIDR